MGCIVHLVPCFFSATWNVRSSLFQNAVWHIVLRIKFEPYSISWCAFFSLTCCLPIAAWLTAYVTTSLTSCCRFSATSRAWLLLAVQQLLSTCMLVYCAPFTCTASLLPTA